MLGRHSRVVRTCQASSDRLAAVVAAVTAALRRSSTVCFSGASRRHVSTLGSASAEPIGEARKCLYLIFSSAKGDAHGPDAVASCHVDFNPRIGTPQGHLLIQRWRRPSPGVLHLLPGLTPGRADQEVIGNGNLRRFDLEPGMLKRNPGLDLVKLHTDLVPGLRRIVPSPDAVGHHGVFLDGRQRLGERPGLPLPAPSPLVQPISDGAGDNGSDNRDDRPTINAVACAHPIEPRSL